MTDKNQDAFAKARERYDQATSYWGDWRKAAREDREFYGGDQWLPADRNNREIQCRPILTINRLPVFARQIIGDARQNKPSIKIYPAEDGDVEIAEIYEGLIRNIEYVSSASDAYDTAFESAVICGIGAWRVCTDYVSDDAFEQHILIERIREPLSITLDPNAEHADFSDAEWLFYEYELSKEEFKHKWPDADLSDFATADAMPGWLDRETVRVAEYWYKERSKKTIYLLGDGTVTDKVFAGMDIVRKRDVEAVKVKRATMSGWTFLDDPQDWPGTMFPFAIVTGEEYRIQNKTDYRGIVRNAVDAQRMYNYWRDLSLDTPIPTPDGWVLMRDIHENSIVFNEAGEPCRVMGESPTYNDKTCYRVSFGDGESIIASAEHTWTIERRGGRSGKGIKWEKIDVATEELNTKTDYIWAAKPLELPEMELPVDPYVLGYWIGNGRSIGSEIYCHAVDAVHIVDKFRSAGYDVSDVRSEKDSKCVRFTAYGLITDIKASGACGKVIPPQYLRASSAQRRALLQGLMDSDGGCNSKTNQSSFDTVTPSIADGMRELLRTMGICFGEMSINGRSLSYRGNDVTCANVIRFTFTAYADDEVFSLPRKAELLPVRKHERRTRRHRIASVVKVDSVQTKCIMVDTPSHLFLAGYGMVPTHNTMETENIALAPKTPFMVADDQIEGLEQEWNNLNTVPMPYVRYNANSQAPMPQQIQPPQIPTAYANASAVCVDEIKATTGLFNASLGEGGTESSGRAILARQREGDTATFIWVDNLNRAIRYTGKILVELIPKIYDSERIIRVLGPDDSHENVPINRIVGDGMGGSTIINDLSFGRYDVIVDSGPSFATKRVEALNNMVEIARMNPAIMNIAGDLMVKAMDWEGADEIAERLKLMLPPQILAAEKEGEDGQGPQIPPELQQQIQEGLQLIEQQKAEIEQLKDELEDKDEDRRLKQYEIDIRAEIEAAKIVAANPDANAIAAQAAQILAHQFMAHAAGMPDVTEEGEQEQPEVEMPEMGEQPEPMEPPEDGQEAQDMQMSPAEMPENLNIPELSGIQPVEQEQ